MAAVARGGGAMPRLRVMVVDEAPERAEVIGETLRRQGCEVIAVTSPGDMYRQVGDVAPDVIIIDMDSPDRDTLEHLCLLSADKPRPVVMFTHDDDVEQIREAIRAGVSAYIVDGLSADRIRPIIDVAIARFEQYQALRDELGRTEAALADRKVIERAKGLLMKSRGVDEEQAYRLLRRQAMQSNARLVDVAQQVLALAHLIG